MRFTQRLRSAVLACSCALFGFVAPAGAADLPGVYAALHPSLVFINCGTKHGTGFVVSSNSSQSLIATAYHVVAGAKKIAVNINDDPHVTLEATLVKSDPENDLAVIAIRRGGLTAVRIGADSPPVGSSIAIAGYPPTSIQFLESQNELKPELAVGTITAVRVSGAVIQHSAASESGDSGGPLFLTDSGDVVGVVKGKAGGGAVGYVAVGGAALRAFLQSAAVSFDNGLTATGGAPQVSARAPGTNSLVLQDVPGAHHFCALRLHGGEFIQNSQSTVNGNLDYGTPVENGIAAKLGSLFASTVNYVGEDPFGATPPDPQRIAQIAKLGNCVGIVRTIVRWKVDNSLPFVNAISAGVSVQILDSRGAVWFFQLKTKDQRRVFPFQPSDVQNALNDLAGQAVSAIGTELAGTDGSAATNFARYGIPIQNGAKTAFFALAPGPGAATVSVALPLGSAAQAGLQKGDTVVSVNGTPTAGLDATKLAALVGGVSSWDMVVRGADGRDVHVRFDAQDIRWYLQHAPRA